MGTVASLAREIERGLRQWHPGLRKTLAKKLAPTIAAAIQTQTANTAQWATLLPIETERADMRLQWIARLLANPWLDCRVILEPLPQCWKVEAGAANLGFEAQREILDGVAGWLPAGAPVLLAADRVSPSGALFEWLQTHG